MSSRVRYPHSPVTTIATFFTSHRSARTCGWLVHSLVALCCVIMWPSVLFGQDGPAKHDVPKPQHSADIPAPGTEGDRSEAEQADAREEALKSLVGPTPYTVIPVPVIHYSLNESYWVGAALPILESNSKGELQHI